MDANTGLSVEQLSTPGVLIGPPPAVAGTPAADTCAGSGSDPPGPPAKRSRRSATDTPRGATVAAIKAEAATTAGTDVIGCGPPPPDPSPSHHIATPGAASAPPTAKPSSTTSTAAPAAAQPPPVGTTAAAASGGAPRGVPEKLGDLPLRLVISGHNPSHHAWQSGHYYSHPANHLWRILIATGIAPEGTRGAVDDDNLPGAAGVGFLDVGCGHPGTDSSAYKSEVFESWSQAYYARLRAHMQRASARIGCSCGKCGAPSLVAFSGKRQYLELLNMGRSGREKIKTVELGPQALLPPGWPLPASTEVWVCSSTSGAAAMTRQQREEPYRRLAERIRAVEWPRRVQLRCDAPGGPAPQPAGDGAELAAGVGADVEQHAGA